MYVTWPSPSDQGGFTGISIEAEMCPGLPLHPSSLFHLGERGFGGRHCNSDEVWLRIKWREILNDMINVYTDDGNLAYVHQY